MGRDYDIDDAYPRMLADLSDSGGSDVGGELLVIYESVQGCAEQPQTMRARNLLDFTELVADRDGHRVPRFVRVEGW
jgi:hypothetical protein